MRRTGGSPVIWGSSGAICRPVTAKSTKSVRELQVARDELKGRVLSKTASAAAEASQTGVLSLSQVKRLNGCRLDKTLRQVSGHPVWQAGLGLANHMSALKASHVIPVPDPTAMRGLSGSSRKLFHILRRLCRTLSCLNSTAPAVLSMAALVFVILVLT